MGGLGPVTFENQSVQNLAQAAQVQGYNPNFHELDVGVAVSYFSNGAPPVIVTQGANDGHISDQEYLQALVQYIRADPVAHEQFAVLFKQYTGVCLPFLLSDCDDTTKEDQNIRDDAVRKMAVEDSDQRFATLSPAQKRFQAVESFLSQSPIQLLSSTDLPQTKTALETLAGMPTACMGLENLGAAVFDLVSRDFDYSFYHLFRKADGHWEEHVFGSVTVDGALLYLDPTQTLATNRIVPAVNFSQDYVAIPIEPLEFAALNLVYVIREDRKSVFPRLTPDQKITKIEHALLMAPQSFQVLWEAGQVYKEIGNPNESEAYFSKAKNYYDPLPR